MAYTRDSVSELEYDNVMPMIVATRLRERPEARCINSANTRRGALAAIRTDALAQRIADRHDKGFANSARASRASSHRPSSPEVSAPRQFRSID